MSEELYKEMAQSIIDGDSDISTELAKKAVELNNDRGYLSEFVKDLGIIAPKLCEFITPKSTVRTTNKFRFFILSHNFFHF